MRLYNEKFTARDLDFNLEINVQDDLPAVVEVSEQPDPEKSDTSYLKIKVSLTGDNQPVSVTGKFRLSCLVPVSDINGVLSFPSSPIEMAALPADFQKTSWTGNGLPFVGFCRRNGLNRYSFGLIDQLTETEIGFASSIREDGLTLTFGKPFVISNGDWKEILQLSVENISWQQNLKSYREFVDREWPQSALPVPEHVYEPVFSTRYTDVDSLSQDWVLENAFMASKLGFKTWVTGNGWFTEEGADTCLDSTGDWTPSVNRFSDFTGQVQQVQKMGLRYLLNIPFSLASSNSANSDFFSSQLEHLFKDFHLDGFEFDFIDDAGENPGANHTKQIPAGDQVFAQLCQSVNRLHAANPDVMVSAGGGFANLVNRQTANLYRAGGTHFNPAANRWQAALARLLSPDRAVVTHPFSWGQDASNEEVSVAMINAICSVPSISVDLTQCQLSHLNIVRQWIEFFNQHRDTIVHGDFAPEFHHAYLPVIQFTGQKERIISLYEDFPILLDVKDGQKLWVMNASSRPYVEILPDSSAGLRMVTATDKFGQAVYTRFIEFPATRLEVEPGGRLEISEGRVVKSKPAEAEKPAEENASQPKKKKRSHAKPAK